MKPVIKYTIYLLLLDGLIFIVGYILVRITKIDILYRDVVFLTICFSVITLTSLFIFFRGRKKEPDSQTMHLLISISLKLILELVLAFIWFIVAKKSTITFLLLFFILYLAFSLFSVFFMLNTMKHKSI